MTTGFSELFLAAGEWSSLITLVVLALFSGISSFLQRRAAKQEEQKQGSRPPEPERKPEVLESDPAESWEVELRRLLGQPPEREPSRPPALPAKPLAPVPKPAIATVRRPPPVSVPQEEGPDFKLPPLGEPRSVIDRAASINDQVTARLHRVSGGLGRMAEPSSAPGEVAQFGWDVHQHLEQGIARSRSAPVAQAQRALSPQADGVLNLLRSRTGTQQAVLAALVLGPPRGLDFPSGQAR